MINSRRHRSGFACGIGTEVEKRFQVTMACLLLASTSARATEPDFSAIDKSANGVIEPAEIPARDLTVIARYASLAGVDISQPVPIAALQQGRAKYLHSLDGGGDELQIAGEHEFGRINATGVRPFGIVGDLAGRYTPSVRRGAISLFQKFDANRDALLTGEELSIAYRSNVRSWMRGDRDGNGILTFLEVAHAITAEHQRRNSWQARRESTWNVDGVGITPEHRSYAARLMRDFDKNQNRSLESDEIPPEWKSGNVLLWADLDRDGRITESEMHVGAARFMRENELDRQRKNDPNLQHCESLAADMMRRYDLDKDRSLSRAEWQRLGGGIAKADQNGNELIVETELANWLLSRLTIQPGAGLPENLPGWFLESDRDLDGQVMFAEFISAQGKNRVAEFSLFDRNSDGIVTPAECHHRGIAGKTRYDSRGTRVLEVRKEVASELVVPDAIRIADVDVQISILKDRDDDLNIRLVGPDGTTAVLYYTSRRKAWGGGRLFDNTVIDDEAPQSARRLPSPPAHRSFRPQSVNDPAMSSLKVFYGKPAQGSWRLIIGNNAQNNVRGAGLLQGWALLVKPTHAVNRGRKFSQ